MPDMNDTTSRHRAEDEIRAYWESRLEDEIAENGIEEVARLMAIYTMKDPDIAYADIKERIANDD